MARIALILALTIAGSSATGAATVRTLISPADLQALQRALCVARAQPADDHEIVLAYNSSYLFGGSLPPGFAPKFHSPSLCALLGIGQGRPEEIVSRVRIVGQASSISHLGFTVLEDGELILEDVDLSGRPRSGAGTEIHPPMIKNFGRLEVQRSSLSRGADDPVLVRRLGDGMFRPEAIEGLGIQNRGTAVLNNVSLAEFVAIVDETVVVCIDGGLALWNSGKLEMTHVTVARNRTGDFVDCLAAGIFNSGSLTARNSLVANRGLVECSGEIVSTGGNLTDSDGCFTEPGPGDLREGDHGLHFFVTSGDRAAVLLADDSVARGAATGCSEVDPRGFPRSGERCDIGAIEHGAPPGAPPGANPGTVSGLWFQPQRDGHYLQLSFVRPGEALLTWQTFDAGGENLWVYGLGRASGRRPQKSCKL